MKFFVLLLSLISFAIALPVSSWTASEISDDRPVLGRPISDRPVVDRPVEGRPIESRPIGSRDIEARQKVVAGAFIISFKEGYVSIQILSYNASHRRSPSLIFGCTDTRCLQGLLKQGRHRI